MEKTLRQALPLQCPPFKQGSRRGNPEGDDIRIVEGCYHITAFTQHEQLRGNESPLPVLQVPQHQRPVRMDILSQAAQLTSLLHGGVPENVSYRVDGSLTVDIPFTRPLNFGSSGMIAVVD